MRAILMLTLFFSCPLFSSDLFDDEEKGLPESNILPHILEVEKELKDLDYPNNVLSENNQDNEGIPKKKRKKHKKKKNTAQNQELGIQDSEKKVEKETKENKIKIFVDFDEIKVSSNGKTVTEYVRENQIVEVCKNIANQSRLQADGLKKQLEEAQKLSDCYKQKAQNTKNEVNNLLKRNEILTNRNESLTKDLESEKHNLELKNHEVERKNKKIEEIQKRLQAERQNWQEEKKLILDEIDNYKKEHSSECSNNEVIHDSEDEAKETYEKLFVEMISKKPLRDTQHCMQEKERQNFQKELEDIIEEIDNYIRENFPKCSNAPMTNDPEAKTKKVKFTEVLEQTIEQHQMETKASKNQEEGNTDFINRLTNLEKGQQEIMHLISQMTAKLDASLPELDASYLPQNMPSSYPNNSYPGQMLDQTYGQVYGPASIQPQRIEQPYQYYVDSYGTHYYNCSN